MNRINRLLVAAGLGLLLVSAVHAVETGKAQVHLTADGIFLRMDESEAIKSLGEPTEKIDNYPFTRNCLVTRYEFSNHPGLVVFAKDGKVMAVFAEELQATLIYPGQPAVSHSSPEEVQSVLNDNFPAHTLVLGQNSSLRHWKFDSSGVSCISDKRKPLPSWTMGIEREEADYECDFERFAPPSKP